MRGHAVRLVRIDRQDGPVTMSAADLRLVELTVIPGPPKARTQSKLIRRHIQGMLRLRRTRFQTQLQDEVRDWQADLVVALVPFNPELLRGIDFSCRTILFIEENFARSWDVTSSRSISVRVGSIIGRWLAIKSWPPFVEVAVISDREKDWAQRQFPRANVMTVGAFLDESAWNVTTARTVTCDLLVIGELGEARNAVGLAAVLVALENDGGDRLRIHVASRSRPHPILENSLRGVTWLGRVSDAAALYRSASICLVPSLAVSGVKNQVLQGWFTSCPVVATDQAAASVDGVNGHDLISAGSAEELARAIRRLLDDYPLQGRLIEHGSQSYGRRHREADILEHFSDWVEMSA